MAYDLRTRSNHNMFTMASLLQKAIRRGDKERAGYAAMELFGSYHSMLWNRIMTVSCEDCWGILSKEMVALRYTDDVRNKGKKGYQKDTQYVSKAIALLCDAKKSRDACYYACNFVLQTYLENPEELSEDFVLNLKAEINNIPADAFEIKEISGIVGEWEVKALEKEPEQVSIFDYMEPKSERKASTSIRLNQNDIWAALLRKGIRTLDMELAGYAIHNLRQNDIQTIWNTLYVISRNECEGIPTREIVSLKQSDGYVNKAKPIEKRDEIYICKGVMILMYQISGKYDSILGNVEMDAELLINWENRDYIDIRNCELSDSIVPEWVYDVHTIKGKREGETDWGMNLVEYEALSPLQIAFFDDGSWQPRYEYKHLHGLCTEGEYQAMLEYSKTRKGNPVEKIQDKYGFPIDG